MSADKPKFFTAVYALPPDAHLPDELADHRYWAAGSWSHALDDRDAARATVATQAAEIARLTQELKSSQNIILAMANDLGEIHDALGLDPDDAAGAPPILEAIEKLKAAPVQAQGVLTDDCNLDDLVERLWLCRANTYGGELMPQLQDFARALLAAQAPASDALSDDQIDAGCMALLQCTLTELGDYSINLMENYQDDVRRVYAAIAAIKADK